MSRSSSDDRQLVIRRRPEDTRPEPMFVERLSQGYPDASEETVLAAAEIWTEELNQIIWRMLDLSDETIGSSLHIEARTAAIFEMAKFRVWLATRIADAKLASRAERIDPMFEQEATDSVSRRARIENTARVCAEQIWSKLVHKWRDKWPLVVDPTDDHSAGTGKHLVVPRESEQGVRRNHYSPTSANRRWTGEPDGLVREYSRNPDGAIRLRDISPKQWGREDFLYSPRLEDYLKLVDDDGARTCRKLLNVQPLNDLDKRRWIAFLLIQTMRTPSFMQVMLTRMKRITPQVAPDYPTSPSGLRAIFETLFTNNDVYAGGHRLLATRAWTILRAPSNNEFIRADNPVLVTGSVKDGTWTLAYPMAPTHVFQVGPDLESGYDQDFVPSVAIPADDVRLLNVRFASNARRSVIARPSPNDSQLRTLLAAHLGDRGLREAAHLDPEEPWGPLI